MAWCLIVCDVILNVFFLTSPSEMKKLLKYLLPLIVVVAFWNSSDSSMSTVSEDIADYAELIQSVSGTSLSASDSEFCPPRQVSYAGPQKVQNTTRRASSVQRNNLEFAKSGKVINAGLQYFIQIKSIIVHSSLIAPAARLLSLGKLII